MPAAPFAAAVAYGFALPLMDLSAALKRPMSEVSERCQYHWRGVAGRSQHLRKAVLRNLGPAPSAEQPSLQ